MVTMHRMEIAADSLYNAKLIHDFCHLYNGQKPVVVGMEAVITIKLGFPGFRALRRCQWRRKSMWTRCSSARTTVTSGTLISWAPFRTTFHDGSCNGLQHYAALGRDKLGAAAVNLVAREKPADVYSGIAARVLDIMRRNAEKDPATDPNALRARLLINQVDRKLVKQTVMTSMYGVTYIGARDQIKKRLKDCCAIEDDDELFAASCYVAKTTLTTLGEMFEAARSIMSWLGDCAKLVKATKVQFSRDYSDHFALVWAYKG